jgi:hypothetical protein
MSITARRVGRCPPVGSSSVRSAATSGAHTRQTTTCLAPIPTRPVSRGVCTNEHRAMTQRSRLRGHRIHMVGDDWLYTDTGESTEGNRRPCGFCHRPDREDDHDACIPNLPDTVSACCGHGGDAQEAFIQRRDGSRIEGHAAIREMRACGGGAATRPAKPWGTRRGEWRSATATAYSPACNPRASYRHAFHRRAKGAYGSLRRSMRSERLWATPCSCAQLVASGTWIRTARPASSRRYHAAFARQAPHATPAAPPSRWKYRPPTLTASRL